MVGNVLVFAVAALAAATAEAESVHGKRVIGTALALSRRVPGLRWSTEISSDRPAL